MSGWTRFDGRAVALDAANIDTDQLIPARFMSQPRAAGYGGFLLHDLRQDDPAHPLNLHQPDVLITRRNFGSGSSREAAVYALVDFGIRAVFASSFGDIFAANAVNNGLLPARLDADTIATLIDGLNGKSGPATVDLAARSATLGGMRVTFDLDDTWARKLINGWDDIDLTLTHGDAIAGFRHDYLGARDWTVPPDQKGGRTATTKGEPI